LITHEMHVIRKICNRVAVMEAGKVVEQGEVFNVFHSPQAAITKRFVSQISSGESARESINQILENYTSGKLLKITFAGESTEQPVISQLVQQFSVIVNIVHGSITHTTSGSIGTLIVQIDGDNTNVEKALQYLKQHELQTEVIERV
ncbi:MAG: NIL domain-containing protein, partial [Lysinibacillus sp.]